MQQNLTVPFHLWFRYCISPLFPSSSKDKFEELGSTEAEGADTEARAARARDLSNAQSHGDALKVLLEAPAAGSNGAVKAMAFDVAMQTLTSFKSSEIAGVLRGLSPAEIDTLMKYVYRGMAHPDAEYSSALLNWHGAIVSVAGFGPIVRVMADRTQFQDAEACRKIRVTIGTLEKELKDAQSRLKPTDAIAAQLEDARGQLATINPWETEPTVVDEGLEGRKLFRSDVLAFRGY